MKIRIISLLSAFAMLITMVGCSTVGNVGSSDGTSSIINSGASVENKVEALLIKRGINVSLLYRYKMNIFSWWTHKYISDPDTYADIRSKGFDHVRLPVAFDLYYKNGKVSESFLKKLDEILNIILDSDLVVILDFHGLAELNNDAGAHEAEFYAIWEQVAERYKDYPDNLLFELFNEPKVGDGPDPLVADRLNEVQNKVIKKIRATNPSRILVASGPEWNTWWGLKDLKLPEDDPNIIVDIHTYQPMDFTHQGETWYDPNATEQVPISDAVYEEINKLIAACRTYKKNTNRVLWLGEFGMNNTVADIEDVKKYLGYVTTKAEAEDMPWAIWDYGWNPFGDTGFDLYSIKNEKWNSAILEAIIQD